MKILLFGMHGRVGWELQRSLAPLGELVAIGHGAPGSACVDFACPESLARIVRTVAPQCIVNAAAYTAVDRAEAEPTLAHTVNAQAAQVLAREAAAAGAWLVHYSTDYVFTGTGTQAWHEGSATGPLNTYGRSKLEGEQAIRASGCKHLILRSSWLHAPRRGGFARTILELAAKQASVAVVDDQIGAPTGADLLADVTAHVLRQCLHQAGLGGTYHVAAGGATSWHAYACHVIELARQAGLPLCVRAQDVKAVPSSQRPSAARRPLNSRLDTRKLQQAFGLTLPDWRVGVERMLVELLCTRPPHKP